MDIRYLTAIRDQGVLIMVPNILLLFKKLSKAKCAKYGESQPTNYQGCIFVKELQTRQEKILHGKQKNIQTMYYTANC